MFSVIIPLYNKAHTITNTLQSALGQSYSNFEVVIVNDGSTDNSVEQIEKYTSDPRIRIINQENQGVSAARNRGIKESRRAYIAFLDGDDQWEPDYLLKIKAACAQYPEAGLILSGRNYKDMRTNKVSIKVPEKYRGKIGQIDFFHNPHVFAHISATVVKRELLVSHLDSWGSFIKGQKSNEDFTFLFRVALHTQTIYIGFPVSNYCGGVAGQATGTMNKVVKLRDSILFHNVVMKEWINTDRNDKSFKVFMKYEIRHIWNTYLKQKDYKSLQRFISSLHNGYAQILSPFEMNLIGYPALNSPMKIYLGITKLMWRLKGYPRVH